MDKHAPALPAYPKPQATVAAMKSLPKPKPRAKPSPRLASPADWKTKVPFY